MATGYIYDPIFLKHHQPGHPERPERLEAIMDELRSEQLLDLIQQTPSRPSTTEELSRVHRLSLVRQVEQISRSGGAYLDPDTYCNSSTYDAAAVAGGSLVDLTLAVAQGKLQNGFALVRPPGHHATPDQAMGFCIFNNVALAVRAVQGKGEINRLAVVDFDVHHGNGTQAVFENDPDVFFCSTHQYPYFPGTGRLTETGTGEAKGATLNLPLPSGIGDEGFLLLYNEILFPALTRFQPQMIMVSAGYDAHWKDPLAGLSLSLTGYAWISQALARLADEICSGKIVFTLEGGYQLDVLVHGVANSVKALLGRDDFIDPLGASPMGSEPDLSKFIAEVKKLHVL